MSRDDRRLQERRAQRQLIVTTARALAEREGWDAVTTRRLAAEIRFSQPVIYKHFASLDELAAAIAVDGFGELAEVLGRARAAAAPERVIEAIAYAWRAFAVDNPGLYDVMFSRPTRLRFGGTEDTPAPLVAAFAELRAAIATVAGSRNVDTLSEVFWAALHGLTTLGRDARLRPGSEVDRLELLIDQYRPPNRGS